MNRRTFMNKVPFALAGIRLFLKWPKSQGDGIPLLILEHTVDGVLHTVRVDTDGHVSQSRIGFNTSNPQAVVHIIDPMPRYHIRCDGDFSEWGGG